MRKYYKNNIKTIKHDKEEIRPVLIDYIDHDSGESRSKITPEGLTTIRGHNLRYNSENTEDGIYYIAENGSELKVEIIAQNKPSFLHYKTPDSLVAGSYQIEVRTKRGQILRTGRLSKLLKVE